MIGGAIAALCFLFLIFLLFLLLKIAEDLSWSWFEVLIPLWIADASVIVIMAILLYGETARNTEVETFLQRWGTFYCGMVAVVLHVASTILLALNLEEHCLFWLVVALPSVFGSLLYWVALVKDVCPLDRFRERLLDLTTRDSNNPPPVWYILLAVLTVTLTALCTPAFLLLVSLRADYVFDARDLPFYYVFSPLYAALVVDAVYHVSTAMLSHVDGHVVEMVRGLVRNFGISSTSVLVQLHLDRIFVLPWVVCVMPAIFYAMAGMAFGIAIATCFTAKATYIGLKPESRVTTVDPQDRSGWLAEDDPIESAAEQRLRSKQVRIPGRPNQRKDLI